jgi:hypothetical protein
MKKSQTKRNDVLNSNRRLEQRVRRQTRDAQKLLAVTHVLLNIQTDLPIDNEKIIKVMNAIEKKTPLAIDAWRSEFEIKYEGKTILKWRNGECLSA